MAGYIVKRFFASILTMFVLITITFFLMHAVPGGPFSPAEERKVQKVRAAVSQVLVSVDTNPRPDVDSKLRPYDIQWLVSAI